MNKKVIYSIIIILTLIIITGGIVFLIEYKKYKENEIFLDEEGLKGEPINLLKEGKYEEGLNKCRQASYYGELCYLYYLSYKMVELRKNNITTFQKEWCYRIPRRVTVPFWENEKEYEELMLDLRIGCLTTLLELCTQESEKTI